MKQTQIITILGAGSIGTSLGNIISTREDLKVRLLSVEEDVVASISNQHINQKYFPNFRLNPALEATTNKEVLLDSDIVLLGLPSVAVVPYLQGVQHYLPDSAILVNLAKGFGSHKKVIAECLMDHFANPVCALKGPSFAREIINNVPTSLTVASQSEEVILKVQSIFRDTTIFTDSSTDWRGVEILSILKNIYAIIIGIVDAHYHSPNLRFFIFTKAFNEMRKILLHFGGKEETMFNYCGIGDFGLTALNDMSRNHTLGLLIGKGFFTEDISGHVVLEGRIAMEIILEKLESNGPTSEEYPLIRELQQVFLGNHNVAGFVNKIIA